MGVKIILKLLKSPDDADQPEPVAQFSKKWKGTILKHKHTMLLLREKHPVWEDVEEERRRAKVGGCGMGSGLLDCTLLGSSGSWSWWSRDAGSPRAWHRASTCLASVSCCSRSLTFSSCKVAMASITGATWAAVSSRRESTCSPSAFRSQWISCTAHCRVSSSQPTSSSLLLSSLSGESATRESARRSPITDSRPDSAHSPSRLVRGASEVAMRSRSTPGMVRFEDI